MGKFLVITVICIFAKVNNIIYEVSLSKLRLCCFCIDDGYLKTIPSKSTFYNSRLKDNMLKILVILIFVVQYKYRSIILKIVKSDIEKCYNSIKKLEFTINFKNRNVGLKLCIMQSQFFFSSILVNINISSIDTSNNLAIL